MVGKYVDLADSYKSLNEALTHGGSPTSARVELDYVDSEELEKDGLGRASATADGILVPMGFGQRGTEGKIAAVRYARESQRAVLRHLLRHADGGDRVRAPRLRARARQLDARSIPRRRTR